MATVNLDQVPDLGPQLSIDSPIRKLVLTVEETRAVMTKLHEIGFINPFFMIELLGGESFLKGEIEYRQRALEILKEIKARTTDES